jgi:thiamine monophosphate kinase
MGTAGRGLALGIGDDAALVRPTPGCELILTSDWTIEDVHFRLKLHPPDASATRRPPLSDVAAMGGRPRWAFVSLDAKSSGRTGHASGGMASGAAVRRDDCGRHTSLVPTGFDTPRGWRGFARRALRRARVPATLQRAAATLRRPRCSNRRKLRRAQSRALARIFRQAKAGDIAAETDRAMDISDGLDRLLAGCRASVGARWNALPAHSAAVSDCAVFR